MWAVNTSATTGDIDASPEGTAVVAFDFGQAITVLA